MDPCYASAFDSLDEEFARLCARPAACRTVLGWLRAEGALDDADVEDGLRENGLREVLVRLRRPSGSERWLYVLVRHAAASGVEGQWAAVAAAWAMQPAARRIARSLAGFTRRTPEARLEVAAVVVAALWQAVREYPYQRRPRHLAIGITWDVRHRANAELRSGDGEVPLGRDAEEIQAAGMVLTRTRSGRARFPLPADEAKQPSVLAERRDLARRARSVGLEEYLDLPGELAAAPAERVAVVEVLVRVLEAGLVEPAVMREVTGYYRDQAPPVASMGSPAAVRQRRSRALRRVRAAARELAVAA